MVKPSEAERLPRSFYQRRAIDVAQGLLGQRLVSIVEGQRTSGIIVETEAYLGVGDKASHTYGGRRTERNSTMWGQGGHAYVYFVYGMHHCVNAVAGRNGNPVAALIRALEPDEGVPLMAARRPEGRRRIDLCSGPGKLCQALGITRAHNGADLVGGAEVFVERLRGRRLAAAKIGTGARIGVGYADDWREKPLRFWIAGNPHVSVQPSPAPTHGPPLKG